MKKMFLALMVLMFAQTAYAAELSVSDAWVRLVPPVAKSTAAYVVVHNDGANDVKLIGVTCGAAASADLHGMRMDGNRMVMFPLPEVAVPANGEAAFAPGGAHVMLMGLKQPLKEGDKVEIVFHLSDGETLTVLAPVRDMRMGQDHQHHGGMN